MTPSPQAILRDIGDAGPHRIAIGPQPERRPSSAIRATVDTVHTEQRQRELRAARPEQSDDAEHFAPVQREADIGEFAAA